MSLIYTICHKFEKALDGCGDGTRTRCAPGVVDYPRGKEVDFVVIASVLCKASAVTTAQTSLDLIDTRMDKLTVRTPMDGVVLVRSVEVGEVLQAGMPILTIGNLDSLKVTVYIPETQYGQISLGQQATLSVDSFPNETFTALVTRISDKAEFTPQNVQTKEGRQTTVYAIELSVDNADGKLKPSMPADVIFENDATK